MNWNATADETLTLTGAEPRDHQAASQALSALAGCGEHEASLAESLRLGIQAGKLQAMSLATLGDLCHGNGAAREPARAASMALFQRVLPTPKPGQIPEFFWRVARLIGAATPSVHSGLGPVDYRSFADRDRAAAFATEVGEGLITITEAASGSHLPTTTVWFRRQLHGEA